MKLQTLLRSFLVAPFCMATLAGSAHALTILSTSSSNASASAEAVISESNSGLLTISLTQLTGGIKNESDSVLVSGLNITFDSAPASAGGLTQSGQLINLTAGSKGAADTVVPVSGNPIHWGIGLTGTNLYLETVGPYAKGGQPEDQIIDDSGVYTVNNSVLNHLPVIQGTGTFTIQLPTDFVADINSVAFQFSTAPGFDPGIACTKGCDLIGQMMPAVPEPATWALLIMGFGGIGATMRRQRARLSLTPAHGH